MTYYANSSSAESEPTAHASLWHRVRPADTGGKTSLLFWLTVFGLGCVSLLSMTALASYALSAKGSEKLLRVSLLLPKLNSIHGDRKAPAFHMSEPEPSELAHPKERKTSAPEHALPAVIDHPMGPITEVPHHSAPTVATPEPPVYASLQPLETSIPSLVPPPIVETCNDPVVYLQPCCSPPGDSPMIRNWKTLTMYSLLSAAAISLAPPPAVVFADEKQKETKVADDKALKDLTERIAALENKKLSKEEIEAIGTAIFKRLEEPLGKLDAKIEDVKGSVATQKNELLQLKAQLDQQKFLIDLLTKKLDAIPATPTVDKDLVETLKSLRDGIAKWTPPQERKAMSPPVAGGPEMGKVELINFYEGELLFIINGVTHRVAGGSWKMIENVPAGELRVEVAADRFGLFNTQVATLAPGKTYKLTATPQR